MAITKAELQDKYDALLAEHEGMKDRLLTVAYEAAYEHDLCKVLDETLAKVGIEVPEVEVIVESATVYKIPLTVAHRVGFLDESNDLKVLAKDHQNYGILNAEWNEDEEDFGIPGGLKVDDPVITNVTIKQPLKAA